MTSQTKEKRGTTSARRRRDLLLLVTELQQLQARFPRLRPDIQDNIDGHLRQADRTREADRQDVLSTLENWRGAGSTVEDVMEDTGLSERTVRGVLDELLSEDPPRVVVYERPKQQDQRGRPAKVYDLAPV